MKGKFITFEGSEGSGKSTQARLLYQHLKVKGKNVLFIREPGGVKISEVIRKVLLDVHNDNMTKECETLLYMAARSQLVFEVIAPALKAGTVVICDRFLDSTVAYQGYGNGVDIKFIKQLGQFVTDGIKPSLTFIMDLSTVQGLSRTGKNKDRIEQRAASYHNRVRKGYLAVARQEPNRVKVIDARGSRMEIQSIVRDFVEKIL